MKRYDVLKSRECWKLFLFLARRKKPITTQQISKILRKKPTTISDQLNDLYRDGFLKKEKVGKEVFYSVDWEGFRNNLLEFGIMSLEAGMEDEMLRVAFKFRRDDKERLKQIFAEKIPLEVLRDYVVEIEEIITTYEVTLERIIKNFWKALYHLFKDYRPENKKLKKYFGKKEAQLLSNVGELIEWMDSKPEEVSLLTAFQTANII